MDTIEADRLTNQQLTIPYGIGYVDDALVGLTPGDLVVIGASTGAGKTELALTIARSLSAAGRKTLFLALEADPGEIENRNRYSHLKKTIKKNMPAIEVPEYVYWKKRPDPDIARLTERLIPEADEELRNVEIKYNSIRQDYDLDDFEMDIGSSKADVVIVDHFHYFETGDENELRAYKRAMKLIRARALLDQKPVVLLAHFNKASQSEALPTLQAFHGAGDVTKIATHVLALSSAEGDQHTDDLTWPTYIQILKARDAGYLRRFIALVGYDELTKSYKPNYMPLVKKDGQLTPRGFLRPTWMKHARHIPFTMGG